MGFGSKACMVFCYLNGMCAILIAWLFHIQINSFSIPTVENGWDPAQKARACRNAGLIYLIFAVFLTFKSWRDDKKAALAFALRPSWNDRLIEFDLDEHDEASAPLLPRSNRPTGLASEGPGTDAGAARFAPGPSSGVAARKKNYGSGRA